MSHALLNVPVLQPTSAAAAAADDAISAIATSSAIATISATAAAAHRYLLGHPRNNACELPSTLRHRGGAGNDGRSLLTPCGLTPCGFCPTRRL